MIRIDDREPPSARGCRRTAGPALPTTHSSARKISSSMRVVPRSSPSITRMARIAVPGISGISRLPPLGRAGRRFSLRASRSAPQSRKASLANSDGWICRPAELDPALRAATVGPPTPSTSTRPRKRQRHQRVGQRPGRAGATARRSHISGRPIARRATASAEPVERRPARARASGRGRGQHHHQARAPSSSSAAAEDQVVGGQRPVEQPRSPAGLAASRPGPRPAPTRRRALTRGPPPAAAGRVGRGERLPPGRVVGEHVERGAAGASSTVSPGAAQPRGLGHDTVHDPSVVRDDLNDRDIRRVSRESLRIAPGRRPSSTAPRSRGRGSRPARRRPRRAAEQPTGDPDDRGVGGQRGRGGVRVGGLGVVDVVDPGDAGDQARSGAGRARSPAGPRATAAGGTP